MTKCETWIYTNFCSFFMYKIKVKNLFHDGAKFSWYMHHKKKSIFYFFVNNSVLVCCADVKELMEKFDSACSCLNWELFIDSLKGT